MNTPRSLRLPLLVAADLAASTAIGSAQHVTFRFAPPDGVRFEEILRHKREILLGLPAPEADITEQRTRYAIRRTPEGYSVVTTPVTRTALDRQAANLIAAVASQATLTFDLDTLGRLVRVRGAERAFEALQNTLTPELTSTLQHALGQSGKRPTQLVAEGWLDRSMLGFLAGQTLKLDTTYTARLTAPLPVGGTVLTDLSMLVQGPQRCGIRNCMQVHTIYTSSDPALGARMAQTMRGFILEVGGLLLAAARRQGGDDGQPVDLARVVPEFEFSDTRFTVDNLRLIDPETGLLYSEIQTQTIDSRFGLGSEERSSVTIRNTDTFVFQFQN